MFVPETHFQNERFESNIVTGKNAREVFYLTSSSLLFTSFSPHQQAWAAWRKVHERMPVKLQEGLAPSSSAPAGLLYDPLLCMSEGLFQILAFCLTLQMLNIYWTKSEAEINLN